MNYLEQPQNVSTKVDFIIFLKQFQDDLKNNVEDWENVQLDRFLGSMEAFLADSTSASIQKNDLEPSWAMFSQLLIASSTYE